MPKVEMSIDLDAIWERYHAGATTPDDVMRLLLAYDGAKAERDEARAELSDLRAHVERVFGVLEEPSIVVRELLRRARE